MLKTTRLFHSRIRIHINMVNNAEIRAQLSSLSKKIDQMRQQNRSYMEARDRELQEMRQHVDTINRSLAGENCSDEEKTSKRRIDNGANESQHKRQKKVGGLNVTDDGYTIVYTDGACSNNGYNGAKAGIGVWWGPESVHNLSRPVVGGRHTNNTAEIQAATLAVGQARGMGVDKLDIHTDSQFLINCITKWITNWKKNNWQTKDKKPVKNREDLIALDDEIRMSSLTVRWTHVRGHAGHAGNEAADKLAVEGANSA